MSRRPRRLRAAAEPCCAAVERRAAFCLVGNHDLAVLGELDLEEFADDAAAAARWTRSVLAEGSRTFLESLGRRASATASSSSTRARATRSGSTSSRRRSRTRRARADPDAARARRPQPRGAGDHAARTTSWTAVSPPGGTETPLGPGRWLLNPGSVGQPRDGDPRAAWLLLDFGAARASFRRVEYDVARTQEEIRESGSAGGAGGAACSRPVARRPNAAWLRASAAGPGRPALRARTRRPRARARSALLPGPCRSAT